MEPAVKPASQTTHNGIVGVLATTATFQGEMYHTLIEKFASDVKILTHTCPGLVEAIEAGDIRTKSTREILQRALIPMVADRADTIVLGCTHFPFVVPLIKEIVGSEISVIDPAPAIAKRAAYLLNDLDLIQRYPAQAETQYATSGDPGKFKDSLHSLLAVDTSPISLEWKNNKLEKKQ